MIKRFSIITVILALLLTPSMLLAKANHAVGTSESIVVSGNTVTVPLVVTNQNDLVGMDIPLRFSEGITLKEVTFADSRVDYFDLKAAIIDNENNSVVVGLIAQISATQKPNLEEGTGAVANLVFEIDDPSVTEITLEAITIETPNHELLFIYDDVDANGLPSVREEHPEFNRTILSLSGSVGSGLPQEFALEQNYPNPFNPSTNISFDLPVGSRVNLAVYNVLGQEVVTLLDEFREAGSHSVEFNASELSSGVYFYRISAENFKETRKMMLLK